MDRLKFEATRAAKALEVEREKVQWERDRAAEREVRISALEALQRATDPRTDEAVLELLHTPKASPSPQRHNTSHTAATLAVPTSPAPADRGRAAPSPVPVGVIISPVKKTTSGSIIVGVGSIAPMEEVARAQGTPESQKSSSTPMQGEMRARLESDEDLVQWALNVSAPGQAQQQQQQQQREELNNSNNHNSSSTHSPSSSSSRRGRPVFAIQPPITRHQFHQNMFF